MGQGWQLKRLSMRGEKCDQAIREDLTGEETQGISGRGWSIKQRQRG
jgi:hypothetical protein